MRVQGVPAINCQGDKPVIVPIACDETGLPLGLLDNSFTGGLETELIPCDDHVIIDTVSRQLTEYHFSYPHPELAGPPYLGIEVECRSSTCDRCRR